MHPPCSSKTAYCLNSDTVASDPVRMQYLIHLKILQKKKSIEVFFFPLKSDHGLSANFRSVENVAKYIKCVY